MILSTKQTYMETNLHSFLSYNSSPLLFPNVIGSIYFIFFLISLTYEW